MICILCHSVITPEDDVAVIYCRDPESPAGRDEQVHNECAWAQAEDARDGA